jgi:hypothetical protein
MPAFQQFCRFHLKIVAASVVVCTIAQPDYNKNYSVRRNLFNGFELGVLVGLTWPFTIPLFAHRYIKDIVESDPITQPIPREDWTTTQYKTKIEDIQIKQMDKQKDERFMRGCDKRRIYDENDLPKEKE